jgi:hypothetical protein
VDESGLFVILLGSGLGGGLLPGRQEQNLDAQSRALWGLLFSVFAFLVLMSKQRLTEEEAEKEQERTITLRNMNRIIKRPPKSD